MGTLSFGGDDYRRLSYRKGSVTLHQNPVLLPYTFSPFISPSLAKTTPGSTPLLAVSPLNFRRGRITLRPVTARKILFKKGNTGAFRKQDGSIKLIRYANLMGALTKFTWGGISATDATQPDHSEYLGVNAVGGETLGAGSAWTRAWQTVLVPEEARYMGFGYYFQTMSGGFPVATSANNHFRQQYVKNVKAEISTVAAIESGPTVYTSPREIRVQARPDRLNWSPNPGLRVGTANWTYSGGSGFVMARRSWYRSISTFAFSCVPTTANPFLATHTVPLVYKERPYVVSFSLENSAEPGFVPSVTFTGVRVEQRREHFQQWPDPLVPGAYVSAYRGHARWQYLVYPTTNSGFTFTVSGAPVVGGQAPFVALYDVLIEQTDEFDRTYFDGDMGPDYIWETGGTTGSARSYYYKNRVERLAALKRIVRENVPMGVGLPDPQLGLLPPDIAPLTENTRVYGTGKYGDGTYGGEEV